MRLRDEADAVILWLDRLKKVGDIAVNVDPMHAGLPWAGIRLLLGVRSGCVSPLSEFCAYIGLLSDNLLRLLCPKAVKWAPS